MKSLAAMGAVALRQEIMAQPTNHEVSRRSPPLKRIITCEPAGGPARVGMQPCELRTARTIWLMPIHGSARITLCTPCADKRTIRRHEPCEHRRHKLDGLDSLAMLLRKNFGVSHQVTMDRRRQLDGKFHGFIVWNGGKLELLHLDVLNPGTAQARGLG
jgi:hypothetical protein